MSFFKKKSSDKGESKNHAARKASEDVVGANKINARDLEIEKSIYEDLLKSVDLPTLSEEDLKADVTANSAAEKLEDNAHFKFVGESLNRYETAELSTDVPHKAKNVDVTPKTLEETIDAQLMHNTRPSTSNSRADVGTMRLDVARISADIQSGEELYRRAQLRIENLTKFVERADIDFSMLNRLEPENRRLKARNKTLNSEVDEKTRKISIIEADLEDHRSRLVERTKISEQAQARLAQASKSLQDYELALKSTQQTSDQNHLKSERNETALEIERHENALLRDKISELSETLDHKSTKAVEAEKMADSLREDCADFRSQSSQLETDNNELRNALEAALKQNNTMKGEMVSLHEDIRTFKTQSEFNIISREDQVLALENQISELTRQVDIKDEIVRNAAKDVSELRKARTAHDLDRDRLEKHIDSLNYQLEDAQTKLLQSTQDVSEFDRRYRDVASALAMTQARRGNDGNAMHATTPQDIDASDDTLNISDEEIADRIIDYKLNLRENIA